MGPNEIANIIVRLANLQEWVVANVAIAAMTLTALAMMLAIQSAVYAHQAGRAAVEAARNAEDAMRQVQQWSIQQGKER